MSATDVSENGLKFIANEEGTVKEKGLHVLYNDPLGFATIGWGHLIHRRPVDNCSVCNSFRPGLTDAQALALKKKDAQRFVRALRELVTVPLNQNQFDALVSLLFNIGEGEEGFAGSTVRRKLNAKDYSGAADAFRMWNKGEVNGKLVVLEGLTNRRERERKMFLTIVNDIPNKETPMGTSFTLTAECSRLVLDAPGVDQGVVPVQFLLHAQAHQRWVFDMQTVEINGVPVSAWRIRDARTGLVLDVAGMSKDDGAPIQLWQWWAGPNQMWYLKEVDASTVQIISVHSGKAIDVPWSSTEIGRQIQQWEPNESSAQKWILSATYDQSAAPPFAPPPPEPPAPARMSYDEARQHIDNMNWYDGVRGFQTTMGLAADGRIGDKTRDAVHDILSRGLWLRSNFHVDEFRCSHCSRALVTNRQLDVLQSMRNDIGPMGKFSSFRCPQHPIEARKNNPGEHARGQAWDPNPNFRVSFAEEHGAVGIGYAAADRGRCTHFDTRDGDRIYFQDN